MFSFRDISRVFESIALVPAKKLSSPEKLMRLWAHETYRVYFDRYSRESEQYILHRTDAFQRIKIKDFTVLIGYQIWMIKNSSLTH